MEKKRKFKSIIRRIIIVPLTVLMLIICILISASLLGFVNIQKEIVNNQVNSLQISIYQLEAMLKQIDRQFNHYMTHNQNHNDLLRLNQDTAIEDYYVKRAHTWDWQTDLANMNESIEGVFVYYTNLNEAIWYRGQTNPSVHNYLNQYLTTDEIHYNGWQLVQIDGNDFIIHIKKYDHFYCGTWLPLDSMMRELNLSHMNLAGEIYFKDKYQNSTLNDDYPNRGQQYHLISTTDNLMHIEFLISSSSLLSHIPFANKMLVAISCLTIIIIPISIFWLKVQIATPVKKMNDAIHQVSDGNILYRIELPKRKYEDEFENLMINFNEMLDKLDDLEVNLYILKEMEQSTKLKYISQQIRPHFMLNALNTIYTYNDDEFHLVKRMVLYLSEYFRYIVKLQEDFVQLHEEMNHVKNYLVIQKERYPKRFEYFVEWEESVAYCKVPPLILQTFVENCIKYALPEDGTLYIFVLAEKNDDKLKLTIADTGNGFKPEVLSRIWNFFKTRQYDKALGVGIQNAVARMDLLYKKNVYIRARNAETGGAVIEILLPFI